MAKCWRCGGGKTISVTTTGTHVLPCPTCGGSGESPLAREDEKNKADSQHPELEPLTTAKSPAADLSQTGSKVARADPAYASMTTKESKP
jgi:hypothetical protein